MKENFSPEMWSRLLETALSAMPYGLPLDDDWPDVRDSIAVKICEEYPELIDADASSDIADALMDALMVDC